MGLARGDSCEKGLSWPGVRLAKKREAREAGGACTGTCAERRRAPLVPRLVWEAPPRGLPGHALMAHHIEHPAAPQVRAAHLTAQLRPVRLVARARAWWWHAHAGELFCCGSLRLGGRLLPWLAPLGDLPPRAILAAIHVAPVIALTLYCETRALPAPTRANAATVKKARGFKPVPGRQPVSWIDCEPSKPRGGC